MATAIVRAPTVYSSRVRLRGGTAIAIYCLAALLHLTVVWYVHVSNQGQPLFPDARGYDSVSGYIAQVLESGDRPSTGELAALSGSQLWGYPALMAVAKVFTSGGWLASKLVLALIGASSGPAAFLLAKASGATHRRAQAAGLSVAASPSLILWDAWGLKDALIVSILLWALLVIVRARYATACLLTIGTIEALLYLRPAAALFVGAALLARFRPRYLFGGVILALSSAIFLAPRSTVLINLLDTVQIDASTGLTFGGAGVTNVFFHPQYLGTFLFGPFPWAYGPGTQGPERSLYFGTIIWIALIGLAPASIRAAWRDRQGMGRPVLYGSSAYALLYLATFGGAFYRQRSALECMLLILAATYAPGRSSVMRLPVWIGIVAALAVLQSSDLTPTPQSKAAFVAVLVVIVTATVLRADSRAAHSTLVPASGVVHMQRAATPPGDGGVGQVSRP